MNDKIMFIDAQEMHNENPESFEVPSKEDLAKLKKYDLVKVCTGGERFWVMISSVDGEKITGRIQNNLVNTDQHGLHLKDEVTFEKRNIYSVWD